MPTCRIPVDLTWTGATGSPGVNVWHGRTDPGEVGEIDIDGLSNILKEFYIDVASYYPSTVTIRFAGEAAGVGEAEGQTFNGAAWTLTGTAAPTYLPPATALYVNWFTNSGGRRGRGRTFLSPIYTGASEANGTPASTVVTTVNAAAATLVGASSGLANGALGVYSRTENVFRDFANGLCPDKFAVLRSRRD